MGEDDEEEASKGQFCTKKRREQRWLSVERNASWQIYIRAQARTHWALYAPCRVYMYSEATLDPCVSEALGLECWTFTTLTRVLRYV